MADFYLYLADREHMIGWTEGGEVPIFPSRKYWDKERRGTQTPDEVIQRNIKGLSDDVYQAVGGDTFFSGGMWMWLNGCTVVMPNEDRRIVDGWANYCEEDSLIICFSELLSLSIMRKLGKTCIVKIKCPQLILDSVTQQLNLPASCEHIQYVTNLERGHQFKSMADAWQAEIRFFWRTDNPEIKKVNIPAHVGEIVDLEQVPENDPRTEEVYRNRTSFDRNVKESQRREHLMQGRPSSVASNWRPPLIEGGSSAPNRKTRRAEAAKRRQVRR